MKQYLKAICCLFNSIYFMLLAIFVLILTAFLMKKVSENEKLFKLYGVILGLCAFIGSLIILCTGNSIAGV